MPLTTADTDEHASGTAPPGKMRAVQISQPGGPEVLECVERPKPRPGPDQVLIAVRAAGVNRPDVMQRKGIYPPPAGASDLPGLEIAGTVVEVGPGASASLIGKDVCALVPGGGYAEYCLADAALCLPVPEGLSMVEAASLPETCFTVWSNVFERGALQPGEIFLVHGGTSGIGVTAIQMARALGSKVIATAGSPEKCAACEQLGAGLAIPYRTEDFVEAALAHTGGRGVDVILDMIGGDYLARNVRLLAEDGRLVHINSMAGSKGTLNLREVMVKRLTITGSTLRSRPVAVKAAIAAALLQNIWPLIARGDIRPVVHGTFDLEQAAEAHALMERSTHIGKIVLRV